MDSDRCMDSLSYHDSELASSIGGYSLLVTICPHHTGILAMLTKEEKDMMVKAFIEKGWSVNTIKSNRCARCRGTIVTYYGERKCINCGREG